MEYCKSNLCSSGPISPVRFTIDNCTGGKRSHSGDGILVSMVQRRFSVPLVEHTSADGLTSAQVKSIQKLRLRQLKMDAFALNILLITFIVTLVLWFPNIVVLCLPFDMWVQLSKIREILQDYFSDMITTLTIVTWIGCTITLVPPGILTRSYWSIINRPLQVKFSSTSNKQWMLKQILISWFSASLSSNYKVD